MSSWSFCPVLYAMPDLSPISEGRISSWEFSGSRPSVMFTDSSSGKLPENPPIYRYGVRSFFTESSLAKATSAYFALWSISFRESTSSILPFLFSIKLRCQQPSFWMVVSSMKFWMLLTVVVTAVIIATDKIMPTMVTMVLVRFCHSDFSVYRLKIFMSGSPHPSQSFHPRWQ